MKIFGEKHIRLADVYNNMAASSHNLKRYQDCLYYYTRSLEIKEKTYDVVHPKNATSFGNLGLVFHGVSNKALEEYYRKKELKIHQKMNNTYYIGAVEEAIKYCAKASEESNFTSPDV